MPQKVKNVLNTNFKTTRINRWYDFTMLANQENTTRLTAAFSQTPRRLRLRQTVLQADAVLLLSTEGTVCIL